MEEVELIKQKAYEYMLNLKRPYDDIDIFEAFMAGALSEEARQYHFKFIEK